MARTRAARPGKILLLLLLVYETRSLDLDSDCLNWLKGYSSSIKQPPGCESIRRSFPRLQTGEVVVLPSRVAPSSSFRHTFSRPFINSPSVVISFNGFPNSPDPQELRASNGTWAVTIRHAGQGSFSGNLYRTDTSTSNFTDGWQSRVILHYIAWDSALVSARDHEQAGGLTANNVSGGDVAVEFGTWDLQDSGDESEKLEFDRGIHWNNQQLKYNAQGVRNVYQGGMPNYARVNFRSNFARPPQVVLTVKLVERGSPQAAFATTVQSVDANGFDVSFVRLDASWPVSRLFIDYIAWSYPLPSSNSSNSSNSSFFQQSGNSSDCGSRYWAAKLDPYMLPNAQLGTQRLPPPVPTTAGANNFSYPDTRWGEGFLAAGQGLGQRGIRLPSSVRYEVKFSLGAAEASPALPSFYRPPFLVVGLALHYPHPVPNGFVQDTFTCSLVNVTRDGFVVDVFRVDRGGLSVNDIGGRGWMLSLDLSWIAWEPMVEPFTVLHPGSPVHGISQETGTYSFFRVSVFDPTHDLIVDINTSSTNFTLPSGGPNIDQRVQWLPHYVFPLLDPPDLSSNRIVNIPNTAPPDSYYLTNVLRLLNSGLVPQRTCHGRSGVLENINSAAGPVSCSSQVITDQVLGPWPYREAFAFIMPEARWYRLECAGLGCPHAFSHFVAPLMMIASTKTQFPSRALVGKRLPTVKTGWPQQDSQLGVEGVSSRDVADPWISEFLQEEGWARVTIFSSDPSFRVGKFYIGVLALTGSSYSIMARVGRIAPLGLQAIGVPSSSFVPYVGRMVPGRRYSGNVEEGGWIYYRLSLSASDISKNTAVTIITVEHASPADQLNVYLRKDEAPHDLTTLPARLASGLIVNETYGAGGGCNVSGWEGVKDCSSCGELGTILGGQHLLGHASLLQRRVAIPRKHNLLRLVLKFVKIDEWDNSTAFVMVDGVQVWNHTFTCDVILDGLCGGSTRGSPQCGAASWPEEEVQVNVTIPHEQATAEIKILTDLPQDSQFALHRSWGIASFQFWYFNTHSRTAEWDESNVLLFSSNFSIPPTDVSDTCTPISLYDAPHCEWSNGSRVCTGGQLCSQRSFSYRLSSAGEYFVGVYGLNVSLPFLRFLVSTHVVQTLSFDDALPSILADKRAEPLPLIQTYPRVSVAHGPGISIGLAGIPSSFYIRTKDKYGNLRSTGGDTFNVTFTSCYNGSCAASPQATSCQAAEVSSSVPTFVFDLGDGNYFVSYTLTGTGRYQMSVQTQGVHIRGSPFEVLSQPDSILLHVETGATFNQSFRRLQSSVPERGSVFERMYTFFSFLVNDMMADVTIEVLTLTGETDVLVSNTREFPNLGTPADVQWRSDWINLGGNVHRIQIGYEDPLFLIGSYHLAVFGRQNATFDINVTVEQVAREIQFGRSYGSTLSTGPNCSQDADCASEYVCQDGACKQLRRFRLRPINPYYMIAFRTRSTTSFSAALVNTGASNQSACDNLVLWVTIDKPYPQGNLVNASVNVLPPAVGPSPLSCEQVQLIAINQPRVGANYYISITSATIQNATTAFSISAASSVTPPPSLQSLFVPPRINLLNVYQSNSTNSSRNVTSKNVTWTSLGNEVSGEVPQGRSVYFAFTLPSSQSELRCQVNCSVGKVLLFLSTNDSFPDRSRPSNLQWRTDAQYPGGQASAQIIARPTDPGFAAGIYYLSVFGSEPCSFQLLCQIEVTAPTVKIGNNYGGRITAQGGYAFYRLLADGLQNRVIIVTKLSVASVAAFTPPLAIYVQRSEPSTSARTLTTCSVQKNIDCVQPTLSPNCTCNGTFTGNWTAAAASSCAWPCDSPFSSDQGSLGQASYQGRTSVEAILVPGSVYYVAVACVPGVTLPVTFSVSFQTF